MNCRDGSPYRAHPDDARRAGHCGLHGRRTGPGGSCIDFRDPLPNRCVSGDRPALVAHLDGIGGCSARGVDV